MPEKLKKKKNNDFEEFAKRNGIYFRDIQKYKKDADFLELCELLEGRRNGITDNLFALRLNYLRSPSSDESIRKKFKEAYESKRGNSNTYGSDALNYLDVGLRTCKLIDDAGRLTEKGDRFINNLSL